MQLLWGHPHVPRELVRLALDNDELVPWFQPVVSARTDNLLAVKFSCVSA